MSIKTYQWERFWCERTESYSLTEKGYLMDPNSEYGKIVTSISYGIMI